MELSWCFYLNGSLYVERSDLLRGLPTHAGFVVQVEAGRLSPLCPPDKSKKIWFVWGNTKPPEISHCSFDNTFCNLLYTIKEGVCIEEFCF